jgi:hypothetical protein
MADVLGLLLCAGAPTEVYCRFAWPAHRAVERASLALGTTVRTRSEASVGCAVVGFADAVRHLVALGVLIPGGSGETFGHSTDLDRLRPYRRRLMRLAPACAAMFTDVAAQWAREQRTLEQYLPRRSGGTGDAHLHASKQSSQHTPSLAID